MSIKKQTVWSLVPILAITAVNLVSVPLFYRFLGAEMYALWFYVLTFTGAFGFMDLGLGVAVGRYIGIAIGKKDLQAVREYWGTGNAIAIPLLGAMATAFALIGVFFGPKWFNVTPALVNLLRWSFVAGGTGLFLSYYAQFWLILSQAHLDFKFISLLRTGTSLLQIIPSIVLAWATRNPLVLLLWAAAIGVLQLSIYIWHAAKCYALQLNLNHASWVRAQEMAAFTGKTFAALLVNSIFGSADRLVLGKLAAAPDFTNYSISSNAGQRILALSGAAMGPVFSHTNRAVGEGNRESAAAVYNEIFDFTFPWYAFVSIWAFLWHPVLLRLWLGDKVGAAVSPVFPLVILACCLTAINNISGAQLSSFNRVGTNLVFIGLAGILLVCGVYRAWHSHGLVGVAWALVISRMVLVVQDLYVIRLLRAGGWLAAKTWKHLGGQIVLGLIFFPTAWLWARTSFWQLIPASLHATLVTYAILWSAVRVRPSAS